MKAGDLRHIISIVSQPTTENAAGEREAAADVVVAANIAAEVAPASAREVMQAQQSLDKETTHTVRIRYRSGIDSGQAVLFGDRRLDIAGIINVDERNVELRLQCQEAR